MVHISCANVHRKQIRNELN